MSKQSQAILCVDDEVIILNSLKTQLQNQLGDAFIIEAAESAEEALEVVEFLNKKQIKTLLIISDWLMPRMKGDEFLIKVHQKYPNIATMMLSGHVDKAAIDNAIKHAQLKAFISKPWDEKDLAAQIKKVLALP
ncbi:response regulator [Eisenibacter elegans]|jgi:CheY-like chemotaxis protein|uniref:response regulator n=1 Tax=Eisenibacter elegans TaxID=997 RepID=UPI00040E37CF|nr:response regulator [Eisenibacter elegans]